jgi:hypothetical protein
MRLQWFGLPVLILLLTGTTSAQESATSERCEIILKHWTQAMSEVPALEANCKRTTRSYRFDKTEVFEGEIRYLKAPVVYSSVEMHRKDEPARLRKIVLNDAGLRFFDFDSRQVTTFELPKGRRDPGNDPFALLNDPVEVKWPSFFDLKVELRDLADLRLFGPSLNEAKKRFDISLKGEDEHCFYIEVKPRKDDPSFRLGRLTLVRGTYLPAQYWVQLANYDEDLWDLTKVNPVAKHLKAADFAAPIPEGWQSSTLRIGNPEPPGKTETNP